MLCRVPVQEAVKSPRTAQALYVMYGKRHAVNALGLYGAFVLQLLLPGCRAYEIDGVLQRWLNNMDPRPYG